MTIDPRHPLPGMAPLVVGAARSGLAAARLLHRHGAQVRVCDRRTAAEISEAGGAGATALAALGIEAAFGRDDASLLEGRDLVVWSPGIPNTHPIASAARARGIRVISELELGFLAAHAPLICITGQVPSALIGTDARLIRDTVSVALALGSGALEHQMNAHTFPVAVEGLLRSVLLDGLMLDDAASVAKVAGDLLRLAA